MSDLTDLTELLAAEADRHRPAHQPPFAELVRSRRRRDRRHRLAAGAALALALGAVSVAAALWPAPAPPALPAGEPVSGTLLWVGGRLHIQGDTVTIPVDPATGTVRFRGAGGRVFSATTGRDGRFSVTVPIGTYTVTGAPWNHGASSPPGARLDTVSPSGPPPTSASTGPPTAAGTAGSAPVVVVTGDVDPCRAEAPVTVPAGGLGGVEVICQRR